LGSKTVQVGDRQSPEEKPERRSTDPNLNPRQNAPHPAFAPVSESEPAVRQIKMPSTVALAHS
jgi:hypothetical protein